jgi:hypothetical protein
MKDGAVSPDFTPPHVDLTFMTPLSKERATRLVGFLADGSPGTVLDIGCGWASRWPTPPRPSKPPA